VDLEGLLKVGAPALTFGSLAYRLFLHRRLKLALSNKRERDTNINSIPNLISTLAGVSTAVEEIRRELRLNGGGSLRDVVARALALSAGNEQKPRRGHV
jgi:hydrogenase-4 membrane subunit HyfE